jgi:putative thioredoxin
MPIIDLSGRPVTASSGADGASADSGNAENGGTAPGANAYVKDSDIAHFAADVLEASKETPVIVDFWAPWCGPCKTLGPMLERAVAAAKGAVRMVKINIDENQEIAQQLRIQSIPTIFAFKDGQPVDGFMGAIPESQINLFIQNLVGDAGAAAEAEGALELAAQALESGDISAAAQIYGQILQEDPGHPKAVVGLAKCYLTSGDLERAKTTLGLVRPDGKDDEAIRAVEAELALKEKSQSAGNAETDPLRARIEADPSDLQARYDLALALDGANDREGAIDQLLEIIRIEREWNDNAARTHLLTIFEAMGPTDPRTAEARRRLSTILFS